MSFAKVNTVKFYVENPNCIITIKSVDSAKGLVIVIVKHIRFNKTITFNNIKYDIQDEGLEGLLAFDSIEYALKMLKKLEDI